MPDDHSRDPEDDEPLRLEPIEEDEPEADAGTPSPGGEGDEEDLYSLAPPESPKPPATRAPVPVAEPVETPDEGTVEILAEAPQGPPGDRPKTAEPEEEARPAPTLLPFDGFGLATWPFRGRDAADWMAAFGVVMLCHMGAWGVKYVPIFGPAAWLMILVGIFFFTAPYQVRVVLAALRGAGGPPAWPRFAPDTATRGEAFRVLALQVAYGLPVILVATNFGPIAGLACAIASWFLYPLSLLLLAVSGSLRMSLPFHALAHALADPRRFAIVLAPALVYFVIRLGSAAADPGFFEAVVDAFSFPVAIYTSLLVGLFARESRSMTALVLQTERIRRRELARLEEDWEVRKRAMEERIATRPPPPRESGEPES